MNCNVCGRELIRSDEQAIGACAVCMNEEIPEPPGHPDNPTGQQPPIQHPAQPGNCIHDIPLGMDCYRCQHSAQNTGAISLTEEEDIKMIREIAAIEMGAELNTPPKNQPAKEQEQWKCGEDAVQGDDNLWVVRIKTRFGLLYLKSDECLATQERLEQIAARIVAAVNQYSPRFDSMVTELCQEIQQLREQLIFDKDAQEKFDLCRAENGVYEQKIQQLQSQLDTQRKITADVVEDKDAAQSNLTDAQSQLSAFKKLVEWAIMFRAAIPVSDFQSFQTTPMFFCLTAILNEIKESHD